MDKNKLDKLRKRWVIFLIVLVLSAYIVPYMFLNHIEKASGAFLYWIIFALIAIFATIKITNYWREE